MISVVMSEIRKSIVSDKATIELHLHLECLLSCLVAKYNSSLFVQGLDLMNVVLSTIPEIGLKPTSFPPLYSPFVLSVLGFSILILKQNSISVLRPIHRQNIMRKS